MRVWRLALRRTLGFAGEDQSYLRRYEALRRLTTFPINSLNPQLALHAGGQCLAVLREFEDSRSRLGRIGLSISHLNCQRVLVTAARPFAAGCVGFAVGRALYHREVGAILFQFEFINDLWRIVWHFDGLAVRSSSRGNRHFAGPLAQCVGRLGECG